MRPSEEKLLLMVEASPNAIILADATGKIVAVNAETEKLFGYPRAVLQGQPVETLVPERFRGTHLGMRQWFFRDGAARPMGRGRDLCGLRRDGTEVPVEIGLNPVTTRDGTFVLASIIDITERKRTEAALVHERNLLRTLMDTLPVYIYVKDRQRRFVMANQALARLLGRQSPEELIGKRDEDFYPELACAGFRTDEERVLRGESVINRDEPHIDRRGQRTEILTTKVPLRDPSANVVGLLGIGHDITELKHKESILQATLADQEKLVADLQGALHQVKTLQGLLPICSFCHRIRNAEGNWEPLESYLSSHTEPGFTHSFCPDCAEKHYRAETASGTASPK